MSYGKRHEDKESHIIERVKDLSTLVIGNKYHLRKFIRKEESTVFDDVYDIILKEVRESILVDESGEEFMTGAGEFEIFQQRKK